MSNHFANYFSTVAQIKLDEHFKGSTSFDSTTCDNSSATFFAEPVSVTELCSIIMSLPNKNSTGLDGIPVKCLKWTCEFIAEPCHIINLSISQGCFPELLKCASVTPVFKKGDSRNHENYRPISVLSVFSKIIEKVISKRLLAFFEINNTMVENQHGFRPLKSTETAIHI